MFASQPLKNFACLKKSSSWQQKLKQTFIRRRFIMIVSRICSSSKDFTNICFLSDLLLMIQISNQGEEEFRRKLKILAFFVQKVQPTVFFKTGRNKFFYLVEKISSFLQLFQVSRQPRPKPISSELFRTPAKKNWDQINADFFLDYVRDTIKSKTF